MKVLLIRLRQNLGEGVDGAGEDPLEGEVSAGGGECDAVGVEGETNGTAVILAPASTGSTRGGTINDRSPNAYRQRSGEWRMKQWKNFFKPTNKGLETPGGATTPASANSSTPPPLVKSGRLSDPTLLSNCF